MLWRPGRRGLPAGGSCYKALWTVLRSIIINDQTQEAVELLSKSPLSRSASLLDTVCIDLAPLRDMLFRGFFTRDTNKLVSQSGIVGYRGTFSLPFHRPAIFLPFCARACPDLLYEKRQSAGLRARHGSGAMW